MPRLNTTHSQVRTKINMKTVVFTPKCSLNFTKSQTFLKIRAFSHYLLTFRKVIIYFFVLVSFLQNYSAERIHGFTDSRILECCTSHLRIHGFTDSSFLYKLFSGFLESGFTDSQFLYKLKASGFTDSR